MKKKKLFKNPARHYFWINPYIDQAFTRCPKCDNKTKVKKIPLVIDADKKALINLNMETKYCSYCDLIIAKKENIKNLDSAVLKQEISADNCFVFGTLDNQVFRKIKTKETFPAELFDIMHPFKDTLHFTVQPAGWYSTGKKQ